MNVYKGITIQGSRYSILERQGSYFVKIKLEAVSVLLLTYCFTFYYLVSIQYNPIWNNVYNWRLKQMYRYLSRRESIRIFYEHFNTVLPQNKLHVSFRFELNKIFSSQHSSVLEEAEIKKTTRETLFFFPYLNWDKIDRKWS